jgi:hypothetical protein
MSAQAPLPRLAQLALKALEAAGAVSADSGIAAADFKPSDGQILILLIYRQLIGRAEHAHDGPAGPRRIYWLRPEGQRLAKTLNPGGP